MSRTRNPPVRTVNRLYLKEAFMWHGLYCVARERQNALGAKAFRAFRNECLEKAGLIELFHD